jgi:hypothetical protein
MSSSKPQTRSLSRKARAQAIGVSVAVQAKLDYLREHAPELLRAVIAGTLTIIAAFKQARGR